LYTSEGQGLIYIYTYTGGGEYTKNPLEKYNNRKTNTYLIKINKKLCGIAHGYVYTIRMKRNCANQTILSVQVKPKMQ
jgi:hypothetical protein